MPPYSANIGKRLIKTPKLYFSDTGLLCPLLNVRNEEEYGFSITGGSIWENFVFNELVKSLGLAPGRDNFFYRDVSGREADFVITRPSGVELIEAKKSERIRRDKLPFKEPAKLLPLPVTGCRIAAPVQ